MTENHVLIQALRNLIQYHRNLLCTDTGQELSDMMDRQHALKELRTIRLGCARRAGHTTAAMQIVHDEEEKNRSCIYFAPTQRMCDCARDLAKTIDPSFEPSLLPLDTNRRATLSGTKDLSLIIVDNPSIHGARIQRVYDLAHRHLADDGLVLLIG